MVYITLNEANFQERVLGSKEPVLVEFFAEWSGAHHIMAPGLIEMDGKYGSYVKFCRIDIDENKDLAMQYGVQSVPTIILFKNGQIIDQLVGVIPRAVIAQKLDDLIELEILGVDC